MTSINPYRSPSIESNAPASPVSSAVRKFRLEGNPPWRDGDRMVVTAFAPELIKVCPFTGTTENLVQVRSRIFQPWAPSISAEFHVARWVRGSVWTRNFLDSLIGLLGAITIVSAGAVFFQPYALIVLIPVLLLFLVVFACKRVFFAPFLWVVKTEDGRQWIRGAHPGYLDCLPTLPPSCLADGRPEAWRDTHQVVVATEGDLPPLCLMTGTTEDLVPTTIASGMAKSFKFYVVAPSPHRLLVYLSKKWLHESWSRQRQVARWLARTGLAILAVAAVSSIGISVLFGFHYLSAVTAVPLLVLSPLLGVFAACFLIAAQFGYDSVLPTLNFTRTRNGYIWLRGASSEFLANVPSWK